MIGFKICQLLLLVSRIMLPFYQIHSTEEIHVVWALVTILSCQEVERHANSGATFLL